MVIDELHAGGVSTHSRPKAAGSGKGIIHQAMEVSTHSRPKAAGTINILKTSVIWPFQHTAARRRLVRYLSAVARGLVSTHSRPKAAGIAAW